MTQERLTALEDVAALATIGATYPELMLYLQAEMAKCEQALAAQQEPDLTDADRKTYQAGHNAGVAHHKQATKREWVGLTDEEVKHEWEVWRASLPRYIGFAKGIEDMLKEKNT
jgi:hypothetical protein